MGKSNRSINPADALRKKQRKRELKKNKEERKRARETVLAKKDVGRVKSEIARLEHLEYCKSTYWFHVRAQAAYAVRMQEHEKKHEGEARTLVYDPKSGKFVPAKRKGK
ncbi:hypothetical protein RO3G_00843 [Rhizopus delemar RA 99-880]|uniref:Wbp11/ELF5/Saf1 N-terminal domain-containing protein n=1 Tax=Rhizopus delemar (strain RA 99-880 / ATCC MYA-4621 / FGSC 9543 / NRRL 43880) TaxID=246409 RepID=I1BIV9_RHIO9|nr:hypothetical protein RO3G_00843 [Rhizopus delemar RA 99-880]|eukprot:EIE76139.1 hypothetical protein RO3G_00843 [Rhizopus delemar RA 99-880]